MVVAGGSASGKPNNGRYWTVVYDALLVSDKSAVSWCVLVRSAVFLVVYPHSSLQNGRRIAAKHVLDPAQTTNIWKIRALTAGQR